MEYLPTIGLEIHIELKTKTKMFCRCINDPFVKDPNIYVCPVCLGLPGALPFPNKKAAISTIMLGKALNCQIAKLSKWDRKNYFYPDLPKGYQISQYDLPLCRDGYFDFKKFEIRNSKSEINPSFENSNNKKSFENSNLDIVSKFDIRNSDLKRVSIRRIHLEEDTGKLLHVDGYSLVDYNRSGVPLVELVTEPDIESPVEAKLFAQELQKIVRYLGVSDANMEKGEMRIEANVSLASIFQKLGTKVEIKNLNSFRSVERAITYEIIRQTAVLQGIGTVVQETRGWNEQKAKTYRQRVKESESDYRYFPEPDIPPIQTESLEEIGEIDITETYDEKRNRLIDRYNLDQSMIDTILNDKKRSGILDAVVSKDLDKNTIKKIALLLVNRPQILDRQLEEIIAISQLSTHRQKQMLGKDKDLTSLNGAAIDSAELESIIKTVIGDNPKAVEDYRSGKHQAIGFLVAQIIKQTNLSVDPREIKERLAKIML